MRVRQRRSLEEAAPAAQPVEMIPQRQEWGIAILRADRLIRNLAVVGALLLTVVAVRNVGTPEAQSVFGALQQNAGMKWDESIGKLSFVNRMLPEAVQAVWSENDDISVFAPASGEIVHAWSSREPYILIEAQTSDVRAAEDGEVMSIAHGPDEERIVRVRHDNGTEALYGNLQTCYASEGERVYAGDVIAKLMDGRSLAFELRVDGRSVNPDGKLLPIGE